MTELDEIIMQVSKELDIPYKSCRSVYHLMFLFIKNKIEVLPLNESITEEEFNKLRTNFNIPSVGKLSCSFKRYKNTKKRFKILENLKHKENAKDT